MSEIIGIVYPIPIEIIDRVFRSKKFMFLKYLPHTSTKLKPNDKVLFYVSKASKQVVGEGIIEKTEFLTPDESLLKYGDKLFLNKEELENYTAKQSGRTSTKKLLVLSLTKVRKYTKEIRYPRPLTMTGEYITKREYLSLMKMTNETQIIQDEQKSKRLI